MIRYVTGDATRPVGAGMKIIAHVCNDAGGWGAGFVLAISRRWGEPRRAYREWMASEYPGRLHETQFVRVEEDVVVANMIAQRGFGGFGSFVNEIGGTINPPLEYDALETCLEMVATGARAPGVSIHMPRIGCGLAGGTWDRVESIIARVCKGVDVTVYDLINAKQVS